MTASNNTPKTAIITGASAGVGKAAARQLLDLGWRVIGVGRDPARSDAAAEELASPQFTMLRADLASMTDTARLAAQISDLAPVIKVLINNAGGNSEGNTAKAPAMISTADFISNYRANTLGAVQLCQLCVPDMVAAQFGRIINVSSAVAVQPNNMGAD